MVVVALGSNLPGSYGSSRALLEAARDQFASVGLKVIESSRWWRSAAWPNAADPDYLNGVALVETGLDPLQTMAALAVIEADFDRARAIRNAPRTLDLDLIAHGRTQLNAPGLDLPHPRAHLRRFVMGPLAEIAPDWRHPTLKHSAARLAASASVGLDAAPLPDLDPLEGGD